MRLTDNDAVQLWRKGEAASRDAVNLFIGGAEPFVILQKLRAATAAIQELERRSVGVRPEVGP